MTVEIRRYCNARMLPFRRRLNARVWKGFFDAYCTLYVCMYMYIYGWLGTNFTSHVQYMYTVYTCMHVQCISVCVYTVCLVPCATEHLRRSIQSVLSGGPAAQTACRTPQPTVSSTSASTLTATARLSLSLTLSSLFSPTHVWERRSGYLSMLSVSLVPRPICGFFPPPINHA